MLLDKSGLRKKGSIPPDPSKQVEQLSQEQVTNVLASFGIGTQAETEEQKVERIRNKFNNE